MAVMIGQASIDERGKITGGQAGNQSGRELNKRSWYANGWTLLIRAKDPAVAEKMAKACEAGVANRNIGYDQSQRNTLREYARLAGWDLSKIKDGCETDCSAFMAVCAEAAGVSMDKAYTAGNAPATFQMRVQWAKTGAFDMYTDSKYLTSDAFLRRGDVLVNESRHTVMVLSNGLKAGQDNTIRAIVDGKTVTMRGQLVDGANRVLLGDLMSACGLKDTDPVPLRAVCEALGFEVSNSGATPIIRTR